MKTQYAFLTIIAVLIVAFAGACSGGDDDSDADATATPADDAATATEGDGDEATATTEPEASETPEPTDVPDTSGPDLPDSTFSFPLRNAFSYGQNGFQPLELEDLPEYLRSVRAAWYKGGGRLIVVFEGLDLDASGPVCPGNSIQDADTNAFDFISNSPTSEGACADPETIYAPADAGVRLCDGVVSYITLIPDDAEGFVYATINTYPEGEVDWPSVTSNALLDRELTEIDPAVLEC